MSVNIHQIYFNEKSRKNCFDEWTKYNNTNKLTVNFENEVIVDLYNQGEVEKADYFGVFSHDAKSHIHFKEGNYVFNPVNVQKVVEENPDINVFGFEKRRKQQNIIHQAEQYHKGFLDLVEKVLDFTDFLPEIPHRINHIILFNHFIARKEIYAQYVEELLIPAMACLSEIPEAYKDALYRKLSDEDRRTFKAAFGLEYFPYHPFILERLPSLFMAKYNYSFKQIF